MPRRYHMTLPPTKFRCTTCGAEWDSRRGNKTTKVGDTCGSVLKLRRGKDRGMFHPCNGKLKGIPR